MPPKPDSTPEQQARQVALAIVATWGIRNVGGSYVDRTEQIVSVILEALRNERAERALALEAYADEVRDTWGSAYPLDQFPEPVNVDSRTRTECAASMARHMARSVEGQLRARAADARQGK